MGMKDPRKEDAQTSPRRALVPPCATEPRHVWSRLHPHRTYLHVTGSFAGLTGRCVCVWGGWFQIAEGCFLVAADGLVMLRGPARSTSGGRAQPRWREQLVRCQRSDVAKSVSRRGSFGSSSSDARLCHIVPGSFSDPLSFHPNCFFCSWMSATLLDTDALTKLRLFWETAHQPHDQGKLNSFHFSSERPGSLFLYYTGGV